ncbi:hypothetical protein HZY86_04095 [Aerococcaceae bacterium DSM 111020]|nr:hypothetical protein [Aerococcaceae bacterium DSM 111020]
MSKIVENFEALIKEKNIPFSKKEIEDGHHLYRVHFKVSEEQSLIVELIIQGSEDDYVDAQIIYRKLHMLNDRAKEDLALKIMNQMNEIRTGYYNIYLAGDGEIFLRNLMRVGEDVQPLYQTLIVGSSIAKSLIGDLQAKLK